MGNRTAKVVNMQSVVRTETYTYDAVDQVTGVDYGNSRTEGFVYDAVGNRISSTDSTMGTTSYTTNALNQYVSLSVNSVSSGVNCDSRGNLSAQGAWTYTYDSKNRLLSALSTGLGVNLAITYDCQNRVVSRTLNGTIRYFVYDGWSLIAEYTSTGDLIQKYVHGGVIDEILVKTRGTTDAFYHHDALGSTVLLTNSSGSVVRSYEYDAFGKVSNPPVVDDMFSSDPYANRFLYTGREFLKEVSLYDYRNRVYSAELGRFIQADPIRFDAGDVNLYRYVKNYVTRQIDPYGLTSGYDDDWQGSGGTRPDTDEGLPNASIPWDPNNPNPPANAAPCCSKSACQAACFAFIGASQTACSRIPAVGWGNAAQATCRAIAAAAGFACLQSCERCTKP